MRFAAAGVERRGRRPAALVGIALLAALPARAVRAESIEVVFESSPYSELDHGRVRGPAADLIEALLQRAEVPEHTVALYPWSRAYDRALKAPNVLLFGIARTPSRETHFHWIGQVLALQHDFYKLHTRPDIVLGGADAARRYSIGVKRDDVLQQLLQGAGYHRLVPSNRDADTFRKLLAGEVDLMPLAPADAAHLCRDMPADCARLDRLPGPIGTAADVELAFSLGTPAETVARVRAAFERLRADGSVARWMGPAR